MELNGNFETMKNINIRKHQALIELAEVMQKHHLSIQAFKIFGSNEVGVSINFHLGDNYDKFTKYDEDDINFDVFTKIDKDEVIVFPVTMIKD